MGALHYLSAIVFYDYAFFSRLFASKDLRKGLFASLVAVESSAELMGQVSPVVKLMLYTLLAMKYHAEYRGYFIKTNEAGVDEHQPISFNGTSLSAQLIYLEKTEFPSFMIEKMYSVLSSLPNQPKSRLINDLYIPNFLDEFDNLCQGRIYAESFKRSLFFRYALLRIEARLSLGADDIASSHPLMKMAGVRSIWGEDDIDIKSLRRLYDASFTLANLFFARRRLTKPQSALRQSFVQLGSGSQKKRSIRSIASHINEFLFSSQMVFFLKNKLPLTGFANYNILLSSLMPKDASIQDNLERARKADLLSVRRMGAQLMPWQTYKVYMDELAEVAFLNKHPELSRVLDDFLPTCKKYALEHAYMRLAFVAHEKGITLTAQVASYCFSEIVNVPVERQMAMYRIFNKNKEFSVSFVLYFIRNYNKKLDSASESGFQIARALLHFMLKNNRDCLIAEISDKAFLHSLSFEKLFSLYAALLFCDESELIDEIGIKDLLIDSFSRNGLTMPIMGMFYDLSHLSVKNGFICHAKGSFFGRLLLDDRAFLTSILSSVSSGVSVQIESMFQDTNKQRKMPRSFYIADFLITLGVLRYAYKDAYSRAEKEDGVKGPMKFYGESRKHLTELVENTFTAFFNKYLNTPIPEALLSCIAFAFNNTEFVRSSMSKPAGVRKTAVLPNNREFQFSQEQRVNLKFIFNMLKHPNVLVYENLANKATLDEFASKYQLDSLPLPDFKIEYTKVKPWQKMIVNSASKSAMNFEIDRHVRELRKFNRALYSQYIDRHDEDYHAFMSHFAHDYLGEEHLRCLTIWYRILTQKAVQALSMLKKGKFEHVKPAFSMKNITWLLATIDDEKRKQLLEGLIRLGAQLHPDLLNDGLIMGAIITCGPEAIMKLDAAALKKDDSILAQYQFLYSAYQLLQASMPRSDVASFFELQENRPLLHSCLKLKLSGYEMAISVFTWMCANNHPDYKRLVRRDQLVSMLSNIQGQTRGSNIWLYLLALSNVSQDGVCIDTPDVHALIDDEGTAGALWSHLPMLFEMGLDLSTEKVAKTMTMAKHISDKFFKHYDVASFYRCANYFIRYYDGASEADRRLILPVIEFIYQQFNREQVGGWELSSLSWQYKEIIEAPFNRGGGAGASELVTGLQAVIDIQGLKQKQSAEPEIKEGSKSLKRKMPERGSTKRVKTSSSSRAVIIRPLEPEKVKSPSPAELSLSNDFSTSFAFAGAGVSPGAVEANPALSPLLLQRWTLESDYDSDLGSIDPSDLFDNLDKP